MRRPYRGSVIHYAQTGHVAGGVVTALCGKVLWSRWATYPTREMRYTDERDEINCRNCQRTKAFGSAS